MEIFIKCTILFVTLFHSSLIVQGDEFVTLWAPKTILKSHPYSAIVLPTKLQGQTEVALQFLSFNITKKLKSGRAVQIRYPDKIKGGRKKATLIMTLHVYEPIDKDEVVRICSTKSLTIRIDKRVYHTFIQTDKPIYKPGDEVKFKVLVVDRNIRPFHMNNIDVDIIDPLNRSMAHFDEPHDDPSFGVLEGRFSISTQTVLGEWTIQAVVDRSKEVITLKRFTVQKYTLPLFEIFISIADQHVLTSSEVTISIYAKYPFGEFVTANAELQIIGVKNGKSYLKQSYGSIDGIQKMSYKLLGDLNIEKEDMELKAVATFTEAQSGLSYNKSASFFVHTDMRHKVVVKHSERYLPAQLFTVKVIIHDWRNQRVAINSTHVNLTFHLKLSENWKNTSFILEAVDGIATYDFMVPKKAVGMKIKVEFLDSEVYEKSIEIGNVEVGIDALEVYHVPRYPKFNETIEIHIKSDTDLDNVLAVSMTRYGPVKSGKIECNNQKQCQFNLTITEQMMPESTIIVYHLQDHVNVFLGKTKIETENLGTNYLNLNLSSDAPRPKEQLTMSFETKPESKIHLLAFDKRLKFLKDGNDITRNNLVRTLADYDGDNFLLIDDMTSWHECTQEELNRVDGGRQALDNIDNNKVLDTSGVFATRKKKPTNNIEDDDDLLDIRFGSGDNEDEETVEVEVEDVDVRNNFPESWLFETFEVGDSEKLDKTFTVPESMTSWDISAFSVSKSDGLAIMKPLELTVKNEFFIKVNLPYSVRYKEVLKLDVLIYNYVESHEPLDAVIYLRKNSAFQIVKYSTDCTYVVDQDNIRTALVQPMDVQKVSFFIKAGSTNSTDFEAKLSIVKVLISATGTTGSKITYEDTIEEELRVEPIGLRMYDVVTSKFYLDKSSDSRRFNLSGPSEHTRYSAIVSGSYLIGAANLRTMIDNFPRTLEDKALWLKESYEVYRYYHSKGQETNADLMNTQYQDILSTLNSNKFKPSIQFRIVFVDAIAALMKAEVIPTNKAQLFKQFDAIETEFFNNIGSKSTPWFQEKIESEYFKVAFALVPFVKHRNLLSNSLIQSKFFFKFGKILLTGTSYDEAINKGIRFLKNNEKDLKGDTVGLAITAYVYVLYGKAEEAQKLIAELEMLKIEPKSTQNCYKLRSNDASCDNLVTAYTALTYMKLNKLQEATKIFNWLVESNPLEKFTTEHAVLTEGIAEIGINLKVGQPNLKVKMENSIGYQTTLDINSELAAPKSIEFPEYTRNISTTVTGTGFCSAAIISEWIQTIPQLNPMFDISIETNDGRKVKSERTVKVCSVYNPKEFNFGSINDVYYEIELPSGYVYNGYDEDAEEDNSFMEVQDRQQGTVINVHFHDFKQSKLYCVNIKATRVFVVQEISDAAVKVYDYSDKTNVDIKFYRFSNQKC